MNNPTSPSSALEVDKEIHDRTEVVKMTTLDQIANESGQPDFVKIDVEGAELSVLKGAGELLRDSPPNIICEIHMEGPKSLSDYGHSLSELYSFLLDYDIEIYAIKRQRSDELTCSLKRVTGPEDITEAIFLTQDLTEVGSGVTVEQ